MFALIVAIGAGLYRAHMAWSQPLTILAGEATLSVLPGQTLQAVLSEAQIRGWLKHVKLVGLIARWYDIDNRIKAGEYQLANGLKAREFLDLLERGEVIQYRVTFPEGINLSTVLGLLVEQPALVNVINGPNDPKLLDLVGDSPSAEGWFLPETWWFTKGDTDLSLLERSHKAMSDLLNNLWETRQDGLPYATPYEALILASIVEKETAVPSERTEIAGVFTQRLRKGMRLQTDPTVIYGLGKRYNGNLSREHLRDKTNTFNTYWISGLPPTPIAMPGEASLRAVFKPQESKKLYFVARGDGTHAFSENLEEHRRNVRIYQLSARDDYRSRPVIETVR